MAFFNAGFGTDTSQQDAGDKLGVMAETYPQVAGFGESKAGTTSTNNSVNSYLFQIGRNNYFPPVYCLYCRPLDAGLYA